jgi:hypothetical protein
MHSKISARRHSFFVSFLGKRLLSSIDAQPAGQVFFILGRDLGLLGYPIVTLLQKQVSSLQVNRAILLLLDCAFTGRKSAFVDLKFGLGKKSIQDLLDSMQLKFSLQDLLYFETGDPKFLSEEILDQIRPLMEALVDNFKIVKSYSLIDIGWHGTMHTCIESLANNFDFPRPNSAIYFCASSYSTKTVTSLPWPSYLGIVKFYLLRSRANFLENVLADARSMKNPYLGMGEKFTLLQSNRERVRFLNTIALFDKKDFRYIFYSQNHSIFWILLFFSPRNRGSAQSKIV